jgi:large subunit ribosomal protein L25
VLYGHGNDPQHVALPAREFARVVREQGANALLSLDMAGESQLALTKTVTVHPIRQYIEHVDLLLVRRGEKVVVDVHIVVTGNAAPDTLVTQELGTVQVESDAFSIPEEFEVSVEGAPAGTQVLAADIKLPAGVELRTDPEYLVVNVVAAPTASDLEAEMDTEGAGVVEDESESGAAADEGSEGTSSSDES